MNKQRQVVAAEATRTFGGASRQHLGRTPGADWLLVLMQSLAYAPSTVANQNTAMGHYSRFAQAERRPLPATEFDVAGFIGYCAEWKVRSKRGENPKPHPVVGAATLHHYVSHIRVWHIDAGYPPPPTPKESRLLHGGLQAYTSLCALADAPPEVRLGLSAADLHSVCKYALLPSTSVTSRRAVAAGVMCAIFGFRESTALSIRTEDVLELTPDKCTMRVKFLKGRRSVDATPRTYTRTHAAWSPLDTLACAWDERQLNAVYWFTEDPEGLKPGGPQLLTRQMREFLPAAGIVPLPGTVYSSHSYRRGLLSEMLLVGYAPTLLLSQFDWAEGSLGMLLRYFDRHVCRSEWSPGWVALPPGAGQTGTLVPPV